MADDTLVVKLSEDAFQGDAQFTLDVDGVQIAGPISVQASHSGGGIEELTYTGAFGPGPHTVAINFTNDAYGGTASTDRNLYVEGITFNGTDYSGQGRPNTGAGPDTDPNAAEVFSNGTVTFTNVTGGTPTGNVNLTGGSGDDILRSGSGTNTLTGGAGNDILDDTFGVGSTLDGGDGNDHLTAGQDDTVSGGAGDDSLRDGPGNVTFTGGDGRDTTLTFRGSGNAHAGTLTLTDFQAGEGGENVTFQDAYVTTFSFDAIYTHMTDTADGTVLHNDDGTSIVFDGVSRDDFTADNFSSFTTAHVPPSDTPESTLVLHLSEDAWNGDAKFRLLFDGHEMTGPISVSAPHSAGAVQDFTYKGVFSTDPHTVEIKFVNDAYGGTPDTDRNLYVEGISYNGVNYPGEGQPNTGAGPDTDPNAAEVFSNGTVTFNNVGGSGPPPPPPPGSDTLVLHLSEDAFQGDAQFAVLLDGTRIGGPTSVTTLHGSGFQDFTFNGSFGAGPHTVEVQFLNDAYGGTPTTDRNLYVGGITFDGVNFAGQAASNTAQNGQPDADPNAAEMYINGSVTFSNVGGSGPPPSPSGTTSTIAIHVSEDAFNGDAQFNVRVDGAAQIATFTAHASHAAGQSETINITGDFGAQGPGTIDIQFLNDAYGGSPQTDRNLYVQSIDVNGVHFQGNAATNDAANGHAADDPSAAVMDINGTATFHINHTAPPLMG